MNEPLLSVIVPVYNCEAYIEKCIKSIEYQSYSNIEIIIIDDGSTDNSLSICQDLCKQYPNIHLIHQENKGQAATRNVGIKKSKGQLIAFVDGDDYLCEDMYKILYNNLIIEDADISCGGIARQVNGRVHSLFNNSTEEYIVYDKETAINELLDNKRITSSPCDKLFRRFIIENNPMKEGIIFEDYEVMPKWINNAKKIVYTGKPLYYYRYNPEGTMTTTSSKRLDEMKAANSRLDFINSYFPTLLNKMIISYITIGLNVLSCTIGIYNCENERNHIRTIILNQLTVKTFLKLGIYSKFKLFLLIFDLRLFDLIGSIIKKI